MLKPRSAFAFAALGVALSACASGEDEAGRAEFALTQKGAAVESATVRSDVVADVATDDDLMARLSFNPPTPTVFGAKLDPRSKGTLLMVRFAADDRLRKVSVLPLRLDKEQLVFRDDGKDADEVAGDGTFTARGLFSFESTQREHKRLLEYLEKNGGGKPEPTFVGRQIASESAPLSIARGDVQTTKGVTTRALLAAPSGVWSGALFYPPSFLTGVDAARSLMVTDLKVVEDTKRTYNPCTGVGKKNGKWTFGYLARAMAGAGNPSTFVQTWLNHWLADQLVNSFNVLARPTVQDILNTWPKTVSGELDLDKAPFKLLAIVNRIDLAGNPGYAPTGEAEGRFVFQWMDPTTCTEDATKPLLVILEYGVPNTSTCEDLRLWAWAWKVLGLFPVGSSVYNVALELLTERWAKAGAEPGNPNGSALNQLRTNDFKLVPLPPTTKRWELREFRIQPAGQLAQVTVINTPDDATFNELLAGPRATELGDWINANAADVVEDAHSVPLLFPFAPGGPFRSGGIIARSGDHWRASNIVGFGAFTASDVRHHFSLNTCDGCHQGETKTAFTHVKAVTGWGVQTTLSDFLTGLNQPVVDPVDPTVSRTFGDLDRRKTALNAFAFSFCGPYYGDGSLMSLPEREEPTVPFPPMGHEPARGSH